MALLSRIFSRKISKKDVDSNIVVESSIKSTKPSLFSINKNEVRVVLYRECDRRGRKLLFDSTSVEKVPIDPKTPLSRRLSNSSDMIVEISKNFGYKYKKPHADTTNLGETIFGSIAMATRGSSSIKIHLMKDPARIMFTKIIQAPRSRVRRQHISDEKMVGDSQGSSMNSMTDCHNSGSFGSKSGSFEVTLNDSGFDGGQDSFPSQSSTHCSCSSCFPLHRLSFTDTMDNNHADNSSSSLQSGSSLSSLRRRWARSVATSLSFTDTTQSPHSLGKHTKLGVALIIPLASSNPQEMEQFLFERMPLMNNILTRLQHSTEQAYCRREVFVQSMVQASNLASQSVLELLCRSRLDKPVWITLTSDTTDTATKADVAQLLVSDLSHLLSTLDTKHTNFFISTLLTAVLTQHLGWVPSVLTPSGSALADLSRNHPYNPLWAQLSDLQGALSYPPRIAKTVVVGKSELLVQKLLSILSYFIRCGKVTATEPERDVPSDEEDRLEFLLEHGHQTSSFDKEAIKEFSKAGSFEHSNSSSTLTKSRTVLSMKTFCEMDNANSLESGFESSNDFLGESYEDGNKLVKHPLVISKSPKFGKSKSCAQLVETSFSENTMIDFTIENDRSLIGSQNHLPMVTVIEANHSTVCKIESEKQFTSVHSHSLNTVGRTSSKSFLSDDNTRCNSFSRENLFKSNSKYEPERDDNKVIFLLGENEELVNIKTQDESNVPESFIDSEMKEELYVSNCEPPVILIDHLDSESFLVNGERPKTQFVSGDVNSRVVIVRSMPIEVEGSTNSTLLKTNQMLRCLSVPEEAVSETAWVKEKRSREAVKLIRRWLSDSAIHRTTNRLECKLNSHDSVGVSAIPDCVFRTSNRSLIDTSRKLEGSVELLVNKNGCDVPIVTVEDFEEKSLLPVDHHSFTDLPSQSSIEEKGTERLVEVVNSLLGGVSEVYCPELVLQGVIGLPEDWISELYDSLLLEADTAESEAVCILANTDTWEVLLVSSQSARHRGVGVRVGMSQLVANMLETTLHLYNLTHMPHMCLSHMETKLFELCVRSQAMAELLLNSDFLDMATLTSELDLDANDIPLLLSVASTHTPLVTQKYGLSFQ